MMNMLRKLNEELLTTLEDVRPLVITNWHEAAKHRSVKSVELRDSVVMSNFISKFERPNPQNRDILHEKAQESFLETNATLKAPSERIISDGNKYLLEMLREDIRNFSKSLKLDFDDFWFGPGTNLSVKNNCTSAAHKVLQEITCYPHQVELAVDVLLNIRSYRRYFREKVCYLPGVSKLEQLAELRKVVRSHLIVVPGNRFETVDKNNTKRRPIAVESSFAVCFQQVIMRAMNRAIKQYYGVDISVQADKHQEFILDSSVATIDESDASNSIHVEDPEFIGLPRWFTSALRMAAPHYTLVRKGNASGYVKSNICSTMGCGFTFPLLTLINLASARLFDKTASAFGDDVVLKSAVANDFIKFITTVFNFKVNREKSFIGNDRIRESCGAFVVDNVPLKAYSIKWLSEMTMVIPTCNKILYMANIIQNHTLKRKMRQLHAKLISIYRQSFKTGPFIQELGVDAEFVMDPRWAPKSGNRKFNRIAQRYHYDVDDIFEATTISYLTKKVEIKCIRDRRLVMVGVRRVPLLFERRGIGSVSWTSELFHRASGYRLS